MPCAGAARTAVPGWMTGRAGPPVRGQELSSRGAVLNERCAGEGHKCGASRLPTLIRETPSGRLTDLWLRVSPRVQGSQVGAWIVVALP
jgi:hypothetical protein